MFEGKMKKKGRRKKVENYVLVIKASSTVLVT